MGNLKVFENMIENKLLSLHTAYLAQIISVNGSTAKIQPLGLTIAYGESPKKQSTLTQVPILRNARYKISETVIMGETVAKIEPIAAGDIVLCVCCERNIAEAKKGNNALPPLGHHSKSDSIIVGVL